MSDLISRQAALAAIDKNRDALLSSGMAGAEHILVHYGRRVIEELPSVKPKPSPDWNGWENGCGRTYDVQPKKGKWIYHEPLDVFECSVCGRQMVRNIFNYCPWCGAKMERNEE